MPTVRQMVKQMLDIESQADDEPGAYPIIFKNDWVKVKFIVLLHVRKMFTPLPRLKIQKKIFNRGKQKSRGLFRAGKGS